MDKQRIFRALVCFLLVCVFLINISPIRIRVEATGLEPAAAIAGSYALFWFIATYFGVCYEPTVEAITELGQDAEEYIHDWYVDAADDAAARSAELRKSMQELNSKLPDKIDDPDDYLDEDPKDDPREYGFNIDKWGNITVGGFLATAIADWIDHIIDQGYFESPSAEAPEGYAYYNGFLFPEIPAVGNSLTYSCIVQEIDSGLYRAYYADVPLQYYTSGTSYLRLVPSAKSSYCWATLNDLGDTWSLTGTFSMLAGSFMSKNSYLIWSDHDIISNNDKQTLVLEASAPTSKATIFVEPDMYFGDYPDQIKDGEIESSDISLPVFDLSRFLSSSDSIQQDMQQTYNQIYNQQMSYEDYANQIKTDSSIVDPNPDSGSDIVNPSDPTEPEDVGPIGDYALDLTEFFPFCIPYDIKEFLSLLSAAPEAPVFEWDIVVKSWDWGFHVTVDLSPWNDVAALFRKLELLAFIVGLGFVTREKFLRG